MVFGNGIPGPELGCSQKKEPISKFAGFAHILHRKDNLQSECGRWRGLNGERYRLWTISIWNDEA